jgi:hydrogenase nickel incorporation protein HypA/HybF
VHELSISEALLGQVMQLARQQRASEVGAITLRLGPLCGVEPALLQAAFMESRKQTPAAQAQLLILPAALRVLCADCGVESEAVPACLRCAACASMHTRLLSGDELLLESVDLLFEGGAKVL